MIIEKYLHEVIFQNDIFKFRCFEIENINDIDFIFSSNFLAYDIELDYENNLIKFKSDFYKRINNYFVEKYVFSFSGKCDDEDLYNIYYQFKFLNKNKILLDFNWIDKDINVKAKLVKKRLCLKIHKNLKF